MLEFLEIPTSLPLLCCAEKRSLEPRVNHSICRVVRTLSDLWGGVNGHGVNLRDQCGVCDDVTG